MVMIFPSIQKQNKIVRNYFLKKYFLLIAIVLFTGSLLFIKPLKILAPEYFAIHCNQSICVEDSNRLTEAKKLYETALASLDNQGLGLNTNPRFIYCSTDKCYKYFGGGNERAISYPFLGTIIAPTSWQVYISQHELIHWTQFDNLGAISTMQKPEWFREGMAYQFSDAPSDDIPEHYLPLIKQYTDWHAEKSWQSIWQESNKL